MPLTKAPHRRANWHDAYDAQMALWRWYRTRAGMDWLREVYRAQVKIEQAGFTPGMQRMLSGLFDAETGKLLDCDPIFVSEEMCDVVDAARDDFAPEALLLTDLITPRGFLWYERPMQLRTKWHEPILIHAVSWGQEYTAPAERAEEVAALMNDPAMYAQHGDRLTIGEMGQLLEAGLINTSGIALTLYAEREQYLSVMEGRGGGGPGAHRATAPVPVVPIHLAPWWYGMDFEGNEVDFDGKPTGAEGWWQLLQTTFRLMQQRLAHKPRYRPDRASRREWVRTGGRPDTEIVVVRLRREDPETEPTEGGEANYSHRFIVSGHWRNQWYPSEKLHRQIWISPYVKGPEDKPLIVRPRRVFQWQR